MKRIAAARLAVLLMMLCAGMHAEGSLAAIPYWQPDSPAMASIVAYVRDVTDEDSENYLDPIDRVAVFDSDGTIYGELFPTYIDQWILVQRILHDPDYDAPEEDVEFDRAIEEAALQHLPEPDSPRSSAQVAAESFRGMTVDEYQAYVRRVLDMPVVGFEGMTYGEGFYKPMVALIEYLTENGFRVFVVSGGERTMLREIYRGTLDRFVPPSQVIGSVFSLAATGQGDTDGRKYTLQPDDEIVLEGNMIFKTQKMNKVVAIIDEIGQVPVLAFGNSSGDFAMAQYVVSHGGRAYMLLCDDTARDYGRPEVAAEFAEKCASLGFMTVSMRDEFATIYGEDVFLADEALEPAA